MKEIRDNQRNCIAVFVSDIFLISFSIQRFQDIKTVWGCSECIYCIHSTVFWGNIHRAVLNILHSFHFTAVIFQTPNHNLNNLILYGLHCYTPL